MPNATKLEALIPEWKLVMQALEHYKSKLDADVDAIEDEDQQNKIYDSIEKLDKLIPNLKSQLSKAVNEA